MNVYSYDLIKSRHSVRKYLSKEIPIDIVNALNEEISKCNQEGNLNLQLVTNDDNAFSGMKAHYGLITGVRNYVVLVGKRSKDLDERLGYYGQRVVLKAQELGLNTCWIGLSFLYKKTKGSYVVNNGEVKRLIIAVGYGENQGHDRFSKKFEEVTIASENALNTDWFKKGVEYALLAPTATNQQKFVFEVIDENVVDLKNGTGFFSKVDKGIVKLHFEIGAGKHNFTWKNK